MSYIFQKIMYSFRKKIINRIINFVSFFKATGCDPVGTGTTIAYSQGSWTKPVLSQGILKGKVSLYH
jgi:hypothetical protein